MYTYFTGNELGNTPFLCPSDYNYLSKGARFVCQIRAANLICIWLMFFSTLLVTFSMYIPSETYNEIAKSTCTNKNLENIL